MNFKILRMRTYNIKVKAIFFFMKKFEGKVHLKINLEGISFPSFNIKQNVMLIGIFKCGTVKVVKVEG